MKKNIYSFEALFFILNLELSYNSSSLSSLMDRVDKSMMKSRMKMNEMWSKS
jgi:hypothetical protein